MSNLKDKYTEEDWDEMEQEALASSDNDKAKEQAVKDMQLQEEWNKWSQDEEYKRVYNTNEDKEDE